MFSRAGPKATTEGLLRTMLVRNILSPCLVHFCQGVYIHVSTNAKLRMNIFDKGEEALDFLTGSDSLVKSTEIFLYYPSKD